MIVNASSQIFEGACSMSFPCRQSVRAGRFAYWPMAEQIAFISHAPPASSVTGYVRRAGRPRVKGSRTTSVNLSAGERDLLERLAASESATLNDVWRRALHLYAAHNGLTEAAPDSEVSAAA